MERRADAIYSRLGGEHDDGMIYKPKWMRWGTFNRRMNRANQLASDADAVSAFRIMRLLKMLPPGLA